MKPETKNIHGGLSPDSATGAIMTPIYQTSTYVQSKPGVHKGFEYSRTQNPTRKALEDNLASIENGSFGLAFGSGLAAIETFLKTLQPGDEVISTADLYGGSYRLFTKVWEKFGLVFKFVDVTRTEQLINAITENTKWIWVETPTNPMMQVADIEAIASLAQKHHIRVAVDNTFATPYLQNPLDLGAHLVMHSVTKYLAGHSDVVMGALVTNDPELAEQLYFYQNSSGAVPGPQDAFLVLRGIKTLHVRMDRHCENAMKIAQFLESHPAVAKVNYPGLESHPQHEVATRQMRDYGGMISFSLVNDTTEKAFDVVSSTHLFTLAESLGGVESLIGHPASMTHASIPRPERIATGVVDSLIRLSVGIEHVDDLIADIDSALKTI
jgi:cystathionine gamma-lyase